MGSPVKEDVGVFTNGIVDVVRSGSLGWNPASSTDRYKARGEARAMMAAIGKPDPSGSLLYSLPTRSFNIHTQKRDFLHRS